MHPTSSTILDTALDAVRCLAIFAAVILAGTTISCEVPPPPFVPKSIDPPGIVHCNDHTGHKDGAEPWIMGGTCTCTPSQELMERLHADGFCIGMSEADLRAKYQQAGINLRRPGHMRCNGLGEGGLHVVLGGKCMCPPTPGTEYYENVVTGKTAVIQEKEIISAAR